MTPSLEHSPIHSFTHCVSSPRTCGPQGNLVALSWPKEWGHLSSEEPTELSSSPGMAGLLVDPKAPRALTAALTVCKLYHSSACLLTGEHQVEHLSIL